MSSTVMEELVKVVNVNLDYISDFYNVMSTTALCIPASMVYSE